MYLEHKLSHSFVTLYIGRIFEFVALAMINLFVPIYLLTRFNQSIESVFAYYLFGHAVYFLLMPLGAQYINIIGLNNSLRLSIVFFSLYLVSLNYLYVNLPLFISLSIFFLILARLTFWLPYHVDMAEYTDKKNRGKEMSLMWSTRTIIDIVIPVLSGFIIFKFGFSRIFFAAIFIYLLAIVPYMALPDKEEKYSWGIRKTFREFFSKKMRTLVLANMANGAENSVGVVIWPIFIWKVLEGNYFELGAISSLIVLMTVILQLFAGRYADIFNKRKLLEMGSLFYAFGWLAKIFVLTAGQIFVVGTYHSFALILKDTPFETLNYEILADQGHLVDEYTVVKEMAIHAGKVSILFFAIAIAFSCGLQWTFVLAAIATLLVNIL